MNDPICRTRSASLGADRTEIARALFAEGQEHLRQKQTAEAEADFRACLEIKPDCLPALVNLAAALLAMKRFGEAQGVCEKALQSAPEMASAWGCLATALHELRHFDEALCAYDRAEKIAGESAQICSCRANTFYCLGRLQDSVAACRRALELDAAYAAAWSNLGNALMALCRHTEAVKAYETALHLEPAYATARWNLALAQLALGNFAEGWKNYEARWQRSDADPPRHAGMPRLTGIDDAAGCSVVVWCEQGLGDALQFCRYVPLLAARRVKVYFEVPDTLYALMQSLDGGELRCAENDAPHGDYQCPLLSLPGLFATDAESIPGGRPYLRVDAERVAAWRERLALKSGVLNIGVACSGNPSLKNDANRSMPLAAFEPLLAYGRIFLIQKDLCGADREFLRGHPELSFPGPQIVDFADSAAIVENMDVIVSVDTSLAHLAGALGRPLHVLLPWSPEWRWQLGRSDSPWYPQAVLHRQSDAGDWTDVVDSVVRTLQVLA